uniref:Uncharacterized protein n=1 Tax=Anguilla anguilla TaxID=7936 RepID=A0A0E9U8N8_ANGAN
MGECLHRCSQCEKSFSLGVVLIVLVYNCGRWIIKRLGEIKHTAMTCLRRLS